MTRAITALLLAALTPGCKPWITKQEASEYSDEDKDGIDWESDCDDHDDSVGAAVDWYTDADADGYGDDGAIVSACGQPDGTSPIGGDCDDGDDGVYPGADEIPYDQVDQDCDGYDLSDVDGDGYDAKEAGGPDCDDTDAAIHPGATDGWYDGIDQNCDGDPGTDMDEDGYDAVAAGGDDCNDEDAAINPDAEETWYDGVDQDCDGADDYDQDGDGEDADGWGLDCDDEDAAINPTAEEICSDGVDNDCDGLATCGILGELDTLSADGMRYGAAKGDRAGYSVAAAGDLDHDAAGLSDILVGARYSDAGAVNAGAVYLVSGPVTGSASIASDAHAVLTGATASDEAGAQVDVVGDADGDGNVDIIVGAPKYDAGDTDSGAAYLVLGPVSGTTSLSASSVHKMAGDTDYDYAGTTVAGVGDMNRDGHADVAVGAPGAASRAGSVYIVQELRAGDFLIVYAEGVWTGESVPDNAGSALSGVGDVDGDGYDDLLVGAYLAEGGGTDRGVAYLIHGPGDEEAGSLADADARLLGEADGDGAGYAVSSAGDVDGDGYADMLVGAPYEDTVGSGAGVTYLVRGPVGGEFNLYNADARIYGQEKGDESGMAVTTGDVDGDGTPDVVIGAPYASTGSLADFGTTYVMLGPVDGDLSLDSADASIDGNAASEYTGISLAVADDASGDGTADLIVGGWGYALSDTDTNAGAIWVFHGGGL